MTVTGTSSSRLSELRKFSTQGSLDKLYFTSLSSAIDGVNVFLTTTGTTASTYTYYIGGITYVDETVDGVTTTTFSFDSLGYDDTNNFEDRPIIKDPNKENIIDKPEVDNDVFIIRQSTPVFENQYRLRTIGNITELEFYAGGGHFNIVKNT